MLNGPKVMVIRSGFTHESVTAMQPYLQRLSRSLAIVLWAFLTPAIALGAGRDEIIREELVSYGNYRFVMEQRVVHYDDEPNELLKIEKMEAFLIVYKDRREIYRSEEGDNFYHDTEYHPAIGTDVTGDGSPDVVILHESGGNSGVTASYIFELREPLNVIILPGGLRFEDIDKIPGMELDIRDNNFKYWKTSGVNSAFPRVVLRYQDGQYVFDPDLTRKPPLSETELRRISSEIRNGRWHPDFFPHDFLQTTLDLIYTGNVIQALEFIEVAWPPSKPGKDDFIAELFQCQLRMSRWWLEIARLNNLPPDKNFDCYKRFPI